MKVLFICNQNQNRSKTAEHLFKNKFKTKSAGLYNKNPVTEKQLSWADLIIVMEDTQRTELAKRFPRQYIKKQIISLNIPDMYYYNEPGLVKILQYKVDKLLKMNPLKELFGFGKKDKITKKGFLETRSLLENVKKQ